MQNIVIAGKADNIFRTIKFMEQAEKATKQEEKK